MRLFISTLIFFCFATASAQCTYGDIEITVTGETLKRIILTNTVSGEAFQSSGTSSTYDQLPEALNSVSEWEPVSLGTEYTPNLSISWDGYSIQEIETECMAHMMCELELCDFTSDCFEANLLSLSGEFSVQDNGNILLAYYNGSSLSGCIDINACNYDAAASDDDDSCEYNSCEVVEVVCIYGDIEITVTGDTYKRIILTNTASGEAYQSNDTSQNYDQLPDALTWVSSWEAINGTDYTPSLEITWDGYSILNIYQTECASSLFQQSSCPICDNSSDCFESNLLSSTGEFSVQSDGSILLLTACEAPIGFCDCNGGVLDECGVCGGDNSTCTDCAGVVNGEAVEDCAGVCGGASVIDECGVCGGGGIADGACDCDGNIIDECGVCGGGNSSCSGCTNENATNYDSTATIYDGSCMYDQDGYDGAYAAGIASVVCPDGGSSCPGDLDNDGAVATSDLLMFLSAFGDSCDAEPEFSCGGLVSHEGYDYSTVQIGDQCWFSENCRYLPEVSPLSEGSDTDPYFYVYGYEGTDASAAMSTTYYETYGALYNWPAVMANGGSLLCPSGWHIPSDGEFTELTDFLGGVGVAGGKMKEAGYEHWNSPNTGGTNSSGFTCLPGGYRYSFFFSGFGNEGETGFWWSASESGSNSWIRELYFDDDVVNRDYDGRHNGFSARCVRDD